MDAAASRAISTKDAERRCGRTCCRSSNRAWAQISGVRVHEGTAAHESAAALNARAFTHKGDIWLGRGSLRTTCTLWPTR